WNSLTEVEFYGELVRRREESPSEAPEVGILGFEAEEVAGALASVLRTSFVSGSDALASGGKYLVQPGSVANSNVARESASISVNVPESGEYSLWVRINGQIGRASCRGRRR